MSSRSFEKWLFGKWGPLEKSILSWGKDVVWPEDAFCCACGGISDRDGLCAACRESLEHDGFFFAWEARAARILAGLLLPLPEDVSFPPDTVVTWVTMPESRRRERAVDHGRLLAEAFAEKLSLPCRQLLLRRDRREKRQVGLGEKERAANLAGAFRPKEKITFPVLIVDDVRTTGTTLCRCAEALRSGGADYIAGLTVTARK